MILSNFLCINVFYLFVPVRLLNRIGGKALCRVRVKYPIASLAVYWSIYFFVRIWIRNLLFFQHLVLQYEKYGLGLLANYHFFYPFGASMKLSSVKAFLINTFLFRHSQSTRCHTLSTPCPSPCVCAYVCARVFVSMFYFWNSQMWRERSKLSDSGWKREKEECCMRTALRKTLSVLMSTFCFSP